MSAYLCQVKLKKNQISFCIYYIFFPVSTMTCFFFVSFFFFSNVRMAVTLSLSMRKFHFICRNVSCAKVTTIIVSVTNINLMP